jgi:hypothetical protein
MTKIMHFGDFMREVNDDMAIFDNFWGKPTFTFLKGELYNPETHDLVPKRNFIEKEIAHKEEQIATLKDQRKRYNESINEQEAKLKEEIDELKKQIEKK